MTEEEAQQMMNGTTLRPPRMKEWMWPTPRAQDGKHGIPTEWEMTTEHSGTKNSLRVKVQKEQDLWPTPAFYEDRTSVEAMKKMDKKNLQLKMSNLGTRVRWEEEQLWPTPRVKGEEGLETLLKRKTLDQALMHNLKAATEYWPTPTTRDHKGGYPGGRIRNGKVSKDTLDVAVQHTNNQEKKKVQLNPEWVSTYLMGYPRHWLSSTLELQELQQTYQTEPKS